MEKFTIHLNTRSKYFVIYTEKSPKFDEAPTADCLPVCQLPQLFVYVKSIPIKSETTQPEVNSRSHYLVSENWR